MLTLDLSHKLNCNIYIKDIHLLYGTLMEEKMNIKLEKMVSSLTFTEKSNYLQYFKQFNVYETINFLDNIYDPNGNLQICSLETTVPSLNILSSKIIDTLEGTSLEGQHLTGKKLILVGTLNTSLLITYCCGCNKFNTAVIENLLPFSTFIIIPKDICHDDVINLRYLIEDISAVYLCNCNAIVTATLTLQYLDEN